MVRAYGRTALKPVKLIGFFRTCRPLLVTAVLLTHSSAHGQWLPNGRPLCTAATIQDSPVIIGLEDGGAIISWADSRNGNKDIYAQRVSATGLTLWTVDGVGVCTVLSNQYLPVISLSESGGAIIAWVDARGGVSSPDIYAQRIDANGGLTWSEGGIPVCTAPDYQSFVSIVGDGTNGAIVAWEDQRGGIGSDIYAQRMDSAGNLLWTPNGVPVCADPSNQFYSSIISDLAGGAYLTWADLRNENDSDVYLQRVTPSGTFSWAANGIAVCTAWENQWKSRICLANDGGVIVAWDDYRVDFLSGNSDIYAQRVNTTGIAQWQANGVPLATGLAKQKHVDITADGAGGAILVWSDERNGHSDIFAQRVGSQGNAVWTPNGASICGTTGWQQHPEIVPDGVGGAVIVWEDGACGLDCEDLYAARIDATGASMWTPNGVAVSVTPDAQRWPAMISDGWGGIIVAWQDSRSGELVDDIYAQRVTPAGSIPTAIDADRRAPRFSFDQNFPNPFSSSTTFELRIDEPLIVEIAIYDVTGRAVSRRSLGSLSPGTTRFVVPARDNSGAALPSGVYFCRVTANGESVTRKFVISR